MRVPRMRDLLCHYFETNFKVNIIYNAVRNEQYFCYGAKNAR